MCEMLISTSYVNKLGIILKINRSDVHVSKVTDLFLYFWLLAFLGFLKTVTYCICLLYDMHFIRSVKKIPSHERCLQKSKAMNMITPKWVAVKNEMLTLFVCS